MVFRFDAPVIRDEDGNVVARGLPTLLDLSDRPLSGPYTVTEKYDGMHVLVFHHRGAWEFATRTDVLVDGAARALIDTRNFDPCNTYCFELIGPSFRHVVPYAVDTAIALYAVHTASGILETLFGARKYASDMAPLHLLPYLDLENKEGFVVHFQSGVMVRVLFDGYITALRAKEKLTEDRILRYFRNNTTLAAVLQKHHRGLHSWIRSVWEGFTSAHVDCERTVNALYAKYSSECSDGLHAFVGAVPVAYKSCLVAKYNCEHNENHMRFRLIYRQSLFQHLSATPPKKNRIVLMIGVSGSGKTKWAVNYRRMHTDTVILCRTAIRKMIFGSTESFNNNEELVTQLQTSLIKNLLQTSDNGITIIIDNSNLQREYIDHFVHYFSAYAEIRLKVMPLPLSRDSNHQTTLFNQLDPRSIPLSIPRVVQDPDRPHCVVFDIDGTIAERHPSRMLFECKRVGIDYTVRPAVDALNAYVGTKKIFIVSGRPEKCRAETIEWLQHNDIAYDALHMRGFRDNRRDYILKKDIWLKIAETHFISAIYEDSAPVVDLGRALGFTVFQVKTTS